MNQKSNNKTPKPILLCILDGWGIGDEADVHNAIARSQTPNYHRFLKTYPNSQLETSGLAVGLPVGQMGNSEVGHMTIGAGRVIFQDLPRINNAIAQGTIELDLKLHKLIRKIISLLIIQISSFFSSIYTINITDILLIKSS